MALTTLASEAIAEHGFYVPQFEIRIEGANLPRNVLRDVSQVTYHDSLTEIDGFEITVNNWDADLRTFKYVGAETADDLAGTPGANPLVRLFDPCNKQVEVKLGYLDHLRRMVLGTFTTLEPMFPSGGAPTLNVRGLNALHQLRRKQYSHTWSRDRGWKDSEIALDIAQLTDSALGRNQKRFPFPIVIDRTAMQQEEALPYVSENNQYDIDFLLTRARRRGYVVYLREADPAATTAEGRQRHLYFGPSDGRVPGFRDVTFQLNWGATLIDFRPTLTTANQVKSVTVTGWDRSRQRAFSVTVSLDDPALAVNRDLHELLNVCDPREEIVVDRPVHSEGDARSLATAILNDRQKELVKAAVTCIGLPDLRAGARVAIGGVGARFSGTYFITDTTHTINDSGYITTFNARREVTGALAGLR